MQQTWQLQLDTFVFHTKVSKMKPLFPLITRKINLFLSFAAGDGKRNDYVVLKIQIFFSRNKQKLIQLSNKQGIHVPLLATFMFFSRNNITIQIYTLWHWLVSMTRRTYFKGKQHHLPTFEIRTTLYTLLNELIKLICAFKSAEMFENLPGFFCHKCTIAQVF